MDRIEAIVVECLPEASIVTEFRFSYPRRWRFDYAVFWNGRRIAIEVEGGAWTRGRHVRGGGFIKDVEKYNTATAMGWFVFRVVPGYEHLLTEALEIFVNRKIEKGGESYE